MEKYDTVALAGTISRMAEHYKPTAIKVDEIGLGAGTVDVLHAQGLPVYGINTGRTARDSDHFANSRAELWFNLRDLLDSSNPNAVALPNDMDMLAELSAVQFTYTIQGKLQLEPKDITKQRLRRSPDRGDAIVLAFSSPQQPQPIPIVAPKNFTQSSAWHAIADTSNHNDPSFWGHAII
jgi:hypothetical protein